MRRVCLVAPTGAGKTSIASSLILRAIERGERVVFLAHRRELISQAFKRLLDFGLPASCVGILMGGDPRRRLGAPIQVASVDTLRNRSKPIADVVFTDECHRATAKSYRNIAACYPDALHIGLTATPYRANGKGLGDAYDELVVVTSPKQLIAEGYLVEPRVFTVPKAEQPDLRGVRVARGDYASELLEQAMNRQSLVGNIVEHWKKHADGTRTVVFAVSVAHSKHITERFREAGVAAEHLDGMMATDDRDAVLRRLSEGATRVVSNVGVLCLDQSTEILTRSGWVGIDEMTDDHLVAGWRDGAVEFERPREVHRRGRTPGERMVCFDGYSTNFRVTEGHNVVCRGRQAWFKQPARNVVGKGVAVPVSGQAAPCEAAPVPQRRWTRTSIRKAISHTKWNVRHLEGRHELDAGSEAKWRVARSVMLRRREPPELTTDECSFIGFWLGDGSFARLKRGGIEYKLFESSKNDFIVRWIDGLVQRLGFSFIRRELAPHEPCSEVKYRRTHPCYMWCFPRGTGGGTQARFGLYELEPYLVRGGTDLYWSLTESQFEALLLGLWLSDGNHGTGSDSLPRSFCIHNANKRMLDLLQGIASCRGYRSRLSEAKQDGNWILALSKRSVFKAERRRPQFEAGWQPERVWCVTTNAGSIITRRNGCVCVLGNCEGWDQPSVKCAVLARPTKSTGLYLQQAGRILRPWEDHPAIILDHGGCVLEHGLPQDDREFSLEGKQKRAGKPGEAPVRVCPDCNAVVHISIRICPECGAELFSERDIPEEAHGELVEVTEVPTKKPKKRPYRSIYDELRVAARSHQSLDWAAVEEWA